MASRVAALRGCLLVSTGVSALRAVLAPDAVLTAEEGCAVCVRVALVAGLQWVGFGSASTSGCCAYLSSRFCAVDLFTQPSWVPSAGVAGSGGNSAFGCLTAQRRADPGSPRPCLRTLCPLSVCLSFTY